MTFRIKRVGKTHRGTIITTDWKWLIMLAWGPRRVSSRAGKKVKSYPQELTASVGSWWWWIKDGAKRWLFGPTHIVIEKKRAVARVEAAGASPQKPVNIADVVKTDEKARNALSPEEVASLTARRQELRAAGRFQEADEIRDQLIAANVVVQDGKIS